MVSCPDGGCFGPADAFGVFEARPTGCVYENIVLLRTARFSATEDTVDFGFTVVVLNAMMCSSGSGYIGSPFSGSSLGKLSS